ncbi:hypothetical protein WKR98_13405 [Pigmentiphaga sp. YJ18]|uniref:hypothetical protein n=1 Tax=Pigmentiphaga sp. YJ18 TaxID=3134907 RepID=UPI00311564C2
MSAPAGQVIIVVLLLVAAVVAIIAVLRTPDPKPGLAVNERSQVAPPPPFFPKLPVWSLFLLWPAIGVAFGLFLSLFFNGDAAGKIAGPVLLIGFYDIRRAIRYRKATR